MISQKRIRSFRNKVSNLVPSYRSKRNVVCFNTHNSLKHEMTKARICFELQKQGKEYITEAKLTTGIIVDILVLDDAICIEIMISETEKRLKEKLKRIPSSLTVISVTSEEDYLLDNYKTY